MPMPSEPATHHSTSIVAMAPQSMIEQRRDREDVERDHGDGGDPVDLAIGGLAAVDFGDRNHKEDDSNRCRSDGTVIVVSGAGSAVFAVGSTGFPNV